MVHVPSTNMEETSFMTYTAASHQAVTEKLWLYFWGAVMSSILSLVLIHYFFQDLTNCSKRLASSPLDELFNCSSFSF